MAPSGHWYSNFSLGIVGGRKVQGRIDRKPSKFSTNLLSPSTVVGQWADQGFKDACEEEAIALETRMQRPLAPLKAIHIGSSRREIAKMPVLVRVGIKKRQSSRGFDQEGLGLCRNMLNSGP